MAVYSDGTRVSRIPAGRVCPLCGKSDFCGLMVPGNDPGVEIWVCQRIHVGKIGDVIMSSGMEYVVCGISKRGAEARMLEEKASYLRRHPKARLSDGSCGNGASPDSSNQVRPFTIEPAVEVLPPDRLHEMYSYFLRLLPLEDSDRSYLHKEGFTDEMIARNMIRSIPEADGYRFANKSTYRSSAISRKSLGEAMHERFGDLSGLPGFYFDVRGFWTFCGLGGLVLPLFDIYGRIIRLRIRINRRWFDEKGKDITRAEYIRISEEQKAAGKKVTVSELGKYMNFSSYKEDPKKLEKRIIGNMYSHGCQAGSNLGFYHPTTGSKEYAKSVVFLTEGEKKAIVAAEHLGNMVIDVPGVTQWNKLFEENDKGVSPFDILKASGTAVFVIAYDADKAVNENVMRSQDGLLTALLDAGMTVALADWDMNVGKGLDDLLVNGGKPTYTIFERG